MSVILTSSGYHNASTRIADRGAGGGRVKVHHGVSIGAFEWLLGLAVVALTGVYLVMLYQTFSMDLALQRQGRIAEELTRQTLRVELELQAKKGAVAIDHADIFSTMEKISVITYLQPENVAMARAASRP
ncbi:MAG: hypothetical protein Q8Q94_02905 [bacterium]|nr:hypothetical protein [bacterium]MDZ4299859.1 hypothetical protein [Candidatus Sungbacteria bacterium]